LSITTVLLILMMLSLKIVLLLTNAGGLSTGFRTKGGKAVEAGMKGFWYT
jgi:hypothetical protein